MENETTAKKSRLKNSILFTLGMIALSTIAAMPFIRKEITGNNISIGVTDNNDELTVSASFPREKSMALHNYIRTELGLTDLTDLDNTDITAYHTPDGLMNISLESTSRHLEITLNKKSNSHEAFLKLKDASEGIKAVLVK
jgi:hypothetical protein